ESLVLRNALAELDASKQEIPGAMAATPAPTDAILAGGAPVLSVGPIVVGPASDPPETLAARCPSPSQPPPFTAPRAHPQHRTTRPIQVKCQSWDALVTLYTRDISHGGLFVKTMTPLEKDTPVTVRISLPDQRTVELEADVVRVVAPERARDGGIP